MVSLKYFTLKQMEHKYEFMSCNKIEPENLIHLVALEARLHQKSNIYSLF